MRSTWFLPLLVFLCNFLCLFTPCIAKPPHVIFILADDYGYNDVGYHGSEIKTPNIDKLSGEGVRLENYYVQPICTPTRSQLLSGRYQIHTGLQHQIIWPPQANCLPLDDKTLAQALKELGYATHIVGKWHLGQYKKACWPTHRGFDTFFGHLTGSEDYYTHEHTGCGMTMTPACSNWKGYDLRENDDVVHGYKGTYGTHMFTQKVQQLLQKHDQTKPLFLYLPYQAVHSPLMAPAYYTDMYKDIKNKKRRVYAGMVTAMDEGIGNITDTLKNIGMWDDTVIFFSTDNGGMVTEGGNNWPLRGWKHSLWEGGMHGVGFVTGGAFPDARRGTTYNGLIHVSDWFPTIVSGLVGSSVNGTKLDGHDVWDAISTGSPSPRTELLHNIDPLQPSPKADFMGNYVVKDPQADTFNTSIRGAIRVGDWKLITGDPGDNRWMPLPDSGITPPKPTDPKGKRLWLFNIAEDPNEFHDLSEFRPDVVEQLYERLQDYYKTAVPVRFPAGDPKADPKLHNNTWSYWED
ncbi:arylsulfatase B-like isoform X2 [Amphiura filiformis]|uniref:arylsulfatase B-like isoform X2 n=1 Tax=Amphiura filiformis TaxID=82378 RepID=UPI003B211D3C